MDRDSEISVKIHDVMYCTVVCSSGSREGAPPIFSPRFHAVFGKVNKIISCAPPPPPRVGAPLWRILDPPLDYGSCSCFACAWGVVGFLLLIETWTLNIE